MADIREENNVFGGVQFETGNNQQEQASNGAYLPVIQGFCKKLKAFWFQDIDWNKEIKVELTPQQQKVEDEINDFLHQEITWEKVHDFLFQEVTFGKKKSEI